MGPGMKSRTGNANEKYWYRIFMILVWFLIVATAFSQQNGVVEGRLVNKTDPAISTGGVTLEVVALSGGMRIVKSAKTGMTGEFRMEGLPVEEMLMVRAIYKDASYHKQIRFDNSGRAQAEIEVYETTLSTDDIRVEEYQMVFQATGGRLHSIDTLTFNNATKPARTFMDPEGNFRFSKAPAITDLPQMRVTAPGSSMPVVQSALESPDGRSYYSLYPLKPGKTNFDVLQILPYENRKYVYTRKFFQQISSIEIGVIPTDMILTGTGIEKIRTDTEKGVAVYRSAPIEKGAVVEWIFSGGTPVAEPAPSHPEAESDIQSVQNDIGRNALIIGPLLLMGFLLVLWYAYNKKI
jgi:hypothetical protein